MTVVVCVFVFKSCQGRRGEREYTQLVVYYMFPLLGILCNWRWGCEAISLSRPVRPGGRQWAIYRYIRGPGALDDVPWSRQAFQTNSLCVVAQWPASLVRVLAGWNWERMYVRIIESTTIEHKATAAKSGQQVIDIPHPRESDIYSFSRSPKLPFLVEIYCH